MTWAVVGAIALGSLCASFLNAASNALNQITGTTEQYSSAIPEPFTFIPEGQRSIALPDGSISAVPFGYNALEAGVDYVSGDGIIFSLNGDVRSPAYVRVNIGYIDAELQPDGFSRADPFEAANLILLLGGF